MMTMDTLNQTVTTHLMTLAQDAAPAAGPTSITILDYIHKGGLLSYVLVLLSFVAVAMIIWNMIELRMERLAPPAVMDQLGKLLAARQVDAAIEFCSRSENNCFIARVVGNGLSRALKSPFGMMEVRTKLEEAAARELELLDRPTNAIGMLAAVGPMLGLLGTVIGLILAFGVLSGLEGAARSNELSRYMSIALVCTAEGLILAIPCTFLYAMFKRRTTRLVGLVGQEAESLVAALQSPAAPVTQVAKPAVQPAAAAAPGAVRAVAVKTA